MRREKILVIDSLEPDTIKLGLPIDLGLDARIEPLECGDIMLIEKGKVMLIERKTALDLLNSIGDGRLFDQASRMVEMCTLPIVLCHGDFKCNKNGMVVADGRVTKWGWWSLIMAIFSLQAHGVMYLQVRKGDLVEAINYLRKWLLKTEHMVLREPVPFLTPGEDKDSLKILASLPGIGMIKAPILLKFYKGAGLAVAELTQFDSIYPKGVAKGTVQRIRKALGLREDERLNLEHMEGE